MVSTGGIQNEIVQPGYIEFCSSLCEANCRSLQQPTVILTQALLVKSAKWCVVISSLVSQHIGPRAI